MNHYTKEIIKHLDRITSSGNRQSVIFEDFMDITHSALTSLPDHLKSIARERKFAAETPEAAKLFDRLRSRYNSEYCWNEFKSAFHVLLESADGPDGTIEWHDTIGEVYMEWGIPNKNTGQFFTPYHLAKICSLVNNIEELVHQRMVEAWLKCPEGIFHKFLVEDDERISKFVRSMGGGLVQFCGEYFERITVSDCACGSGVMLLAAAETTPRWALDWGLVQFYGQDIDETCVKMAQINMMLYGLNGYNLKNAIALSEIEMNAIPEPYQSAYRQAQAEPEKLEDITAQVRAWKQEALL